MCFVWLSERILTFALYIINMLGSITQVESVYCAVRTESLYNTEMSRPSRVNYLLTHIKHINPSTWLEFQFQLLFRTEGFSIYRTLTCIHYHMVYRGRQRVRN